MSTSLSETAAYKIVRQILDHVWGPDEELEDEDLVAILEGFRESGGFWEPVMAGDMKSLGVLEDAIEAHVRARALAVIACRVARIK